MRTDLVYTSFPELAERVGALYDRDRDVLRLVMLGQDYLVSHGGITLRGQKAPESHETVILDYLGSSGIAIGGPPWRSLGDFVGASTADFRRRVELPLAVHVADFLTRADSLLTLFGAERAPSIVGSDLAITVRALPKVSIHAELSQETADFPAEAWVLFSRNADRFLAVENLQLLGELFKERVRSLLRIY